MPAVEHEHLVGNLDVRHAVFRHQPVDLPDHVVWTPHAEGRDFKRRVDAAERTFERASQAGLQGRVRAARIEMVKQCQLCAR